MTVVTESRLEKARKFVESGGNCDSISIDAEGLKLTPEAVEWLKENHWQVKVAETFGPTGFAAIIYPAS